MKAKIFFRDSRGMIGDTRLYLAAFGPGASALRSISRPTSSGTSGGPALYRPIEAADLPSLPILSSPEPQKLDGQDRLTEVDHSVDSGVSQAFRGVVLSMCCC